MTLKMLVILIVGLIVACTAVPHYNSYHPRHRSPHHNHWSSFDEEMREFETEMAHAMNELETSLSDISKKVSAVFVTQGIQGNEYKLTMQLNGFLEKDIVVNFRQGLLTVQATAMPQGKFVDVKTQLPPFVNTAGSWKFENGVLNIFFPLNTGTQTEKAGSSEATEPSKATKSGEATEAPATEHSRKEISNGGVTAAVDSDADVGLRGDRKLITNEIPRNTVEATTYALNPKDDAELVTFHP